MRQVFHLNTLSTNIEKFAAQSSEDHVNNEKVKATIKLIKTEKELKTKLNTALLTRSTVNIESFNEVYSINLLKQCCIQNGYDVFIINGKEHSNEIKLGVKLKFNFSFNIAFKNKLSFKMFLNNLAVIKSSPMIVLMFSNTHKLSKQNIKKLNQLTSFNSLFDFKLDDNIKIVTWQEKPCLGEIS